MEDITIANVTVVGIFLLLGFLISFIIVSLIPNSIILLIVLLIISSALVYIFFWDSKEMFLLLFLVVFIMLLPVKGWLGALIGSALAVVVLVFLLMIKYG